MKPIKYKDWYDGWLEVSSVYPVIKNMDVDTWYKSGGWTPHRPVEEVDWSEVVKYRISEIQRKNVTDWITVKDNQIAPKIDRETYVKILSCDGLVHSAVLGAFLDGEYFKKQRGGGFVGGGPVYHNIKAYCIYLDAPKGKSIIVPQVTKGIKEKFNQIVNNIIYKCLRRT